MDDGYEFAQFAAEYGSSSSGVAGHGVHAMQGAGLDGHGGFIPSASSRAPSFWYPEAAMMGAVGVSGGTAGQGHAQILDQDSLDGFNEGSAGFDDGTEESPSSSGRQQPTKSSTSSAPPPLIRTLNRPPTQPGLHKHACRYCASTFAKTEHLKRHERAHTKEKPYECTRCGKRFSRADSLVRHGRLHDEEEAERRGGGGDEREDEEEKVENVQVVDGGKKRRRMGTREGVKEEPGKEVDGQRKEQRLVANGEVGGAIDTHDLITSGFSSQAAPPPPPQSHPSPSHGDRPSIARNESASSVLDLARPTITRHESGSSVLDLLAMASMRGGGADGFGGSGGRGSASGDSGGGAVDGSRRLSASGTGTSPLGSNPSNLSFNAYTSQRYMYGSDPSLAPSYFASNTSTPTASGGAAGLQQGLGNGIGNGNGNNEDTIPIFPSLQSAPLTTPSTTTATTTADLLGPSPDVNLLDFLIHDPTLSLAHSLEPNWMAQAQSAVNSPDHGQAMAASWAWFSGPSSGVQVQTPFGGMNATGAPTLQESLERINEENVASSGGAVGNPKAEGQGQMTWDDTTTTADAQDTQALWRSFMHSGGGGPQQDGTIAASQPVHQGAQAGNTGASTSNAVVQSTSIQDAGANAVNGKEEESSAAQGVAARVLAQAAAAASSPIGMNAAISRQGTGRPLEAISEAKTLLSDLSVNLNSESGALSSEFLDLCLQMFFNRFLPTLAIIHRPTFIVKHSNGPLLINMIVIGSLYVQTQDARIKGESLWRLVYKGVASSWDKLVELQGPYDPTMGTPLCQTILLGQMYASMSAKRAVRQTPYAFRGFGVRMAQLSGILSLPPVDPASYLPPPTATPAELDIAWRKWAARETQLRTVLGHYMLDGQMSDTYQCASALRHLANPLQSVCEDALFNAPTAEAWRLAVLRRSDAAKQSGNRTFAQMYKQLLSKDPDGLCELDSNLPTMSRVTLLVGMQATIADFKEGVPYGSPSLIEIGVALDRLYGSLVLASSTRMESSGQKLAWHAISLYLEMQLLGLQTKPNLDGPVFTVLQNDLSWTRTPLGNRMLLHANAVRQLAESLPFASMAAPQFFVPPFLHVAASVMIAWIRGNGLEVSTSWESDKPTYDLSSEVDWMGLGLAGYPDEGQQQLGRQPMGSPQARQFIAEGGVPYLHGQPITLQDVTVFIMWLRSYGNVWGIALRMAEEISGWIGAS